jgi:hypothetical protein
MTCSTLGGRGLLIESLARFGQEPRVLHCDDRLSREILQQRDLLVREGPDFLAVGGNIAEERAVLSERYAFRNRIVDFCQIGSMDESFVLDQPPDRMRATRAVTLAQAFRQCP